MSQVKTEDLRQQYQQLSSLYNTLLQKNQSDQIKIKQKQITFNDIIQTLKQEKQIQSSQYAAEVNRLRLQINQLKLSLSSQSKPSSELNEKQHQNMIQELKNEIEKLNGEIENKSERIEEVEKSIRELMDENISITADNRKLQEQIQALRRKCQQMDIIKNQLQQIRQKMKEKVLKINAQMNTNIVGDIIQENIYKNEILDIKQTLKTNQKQIESKTKMIQTLKLRLRETNDELKRFMERDKKNTVLVKKKNQELEVLQIQLQSSKKPLKTERRKTINDEGCGKCRQWEQENRLLKEMVKSAKTMLRVRQMEMEKDRYKERGSMKTIEERKSRGELPPLRKN